MFGSEILEIVIGLVFIYLLLSLLATTINEIITTTLSSMRGKILQKAIRTMLSDRFDPKEDLDKQPLPKDAEKPVENTEVAVDTSAKATDLGSAFYEHPMIYRFAKKGKKGLPSYLSKRNFSLVVIDLLGDHNSVDRTFESIEETVSKLPKGGTRTLLMTLLTNAEGDMNRFKALLETWFDEMMQRATGWYKRRVQFILFLIGLGLSIIFNADTFQIAKNLASDPDARAKIVKMAEEYQARAIAADTTVKRDSVTSAAFVARMCTTASDSTERAYWCKLDSLNDQVNYLVKDQLSQATSILGLGWKLPGFGIKDMKYDWGITRFLVYLWKCVVWYWNQMSVEQVIGWVITALAVSLGAPFWFDLLNKVMKIRGTGSKPEEEAAKAQKRQPVG